MDFISNKEAQVKEMLKVLGIEKIEELYSAIPQNLMQAGQLEDDGLSEMEAFGLIKEVERLNTFQDYECYLGAGAFSHYVPAIVSSITSKSEFLTSYTPYQAEASQGMLQIIFEFQSAILAMTGLDVANASLYDGASAAAEALLMSLRLTNKSSVIISKALHPHYRKVIEGYLAPHNIEIIYVEALKNGCENFEQIELALSEKTAALLLQSPNFFGVVSDCTAIFQKCKKLGAIPILCADLLSFGLFLSAKEMGAMIAVGDSQSFGLKLQFGGPYCGYIACEESLVRQLPGRLVGQTQDMQGKSGFVLTFQAREQHIRREKATSNICSNQALAALASLITLLWYGKRGVKELSLENYRRAEYLKEALSELSSLHIESEVPTFNEFKIDFNKPLHEVLEHFKKEKIIPGVPLKRYYPEFQNSLLVAVTEMKSKKDLDRYIEVARKL